jgi:hypothetical protein
MPAIRYVTDARGEKRAAGEVETISLDHFERELVADGLVPG